VTNYLTFNIQPFNTLHSPVVLWSLMLMAGW